MVRVVVLFRKFREINPSGSGIGSADVVAVSWYSTPQQIDIVVGRRYKSRIRPDLVAFLCNFFRFLVDTGD